MKRILILLAICFIGLSTNAQNLYKHAIGASFGNYATHKIYTTDVFDDIERAFYGVSGGVDYIYRPNKRFALNARIEYLSFGARQRLSDLRFGNQFTGTGFDPTLNPGEDIDYPYKNTDRLGNLSVAIIPNLYITNKKKIAVYVLAGVAYQRKLHIKIKTNQSFNETYRTTLPGGTIMMTDVNDLAIIAGLGFEHVCGGNHILRWEPIFRMADVTKWGSRDFLFQARQIYAGVNVSFAFGLGKNTSSGA